MLRRLLGHTFQIRPMEMALVQACFLCFLGCGTFCAVVGTAGETLFLSRLGTARAQQLLPWTYLGMALVTIALTLLYTSLQTRVSRIRLIVGTQVFLAMSLVAWHQCTPTGQGGQSVFYLSLNIWLAASTLLVTMLVYSFVGDYFTTRDARRLYGYMTGGVALGTMLGGAVSGPLAAWLGTNALLFVGSALLVAIAGLARGIAGRAQSVADLEPPSVARAPLRPMLENPYVLLLIAMVLLSNVCWVVVDYVTEIQASRVMDEREMGVFFGGLFAAVGLASMIVQFGFLGWLFEHVGVARSLLLLPLVQAGFAVGFFYFPWLWLLATSRCLFRSMADTVETPAQQLLFLPLSTRVRLAAQALVDGVAAPASYGLGGLVLLVLLPLLPALHNVSILVAGMAVAWTGVVMLLIPQYTRTLANSLREQRLNAADLSRLLDRPESRAALRSLLDDENPQMALTAFELMHGKPLGPLLESVIALSTSPHEAVAVEALALLGREGGPHSVASVRQALDDPREAVRAAAVGALCAILQEDAVDEMSRLLDTAERPSRVAALLGLARHGGCGGALLAYPRLDALLHSARPLDRIEGVQVLARIETQRASRIMARLLADPDLSVRAAALEAACQNPQVGLANDLLARLHEPPLRALSVRALTMLGPSAASTLSRALADGRLDTTERRLLTTVLGNIGGEEAARALWDLLAPQQPLLVRASAAAALNRLRTRERFLKPSFEGLDERRHELCEALSLFIRARTELRSDLLSRLLMTDHVRVHQRLLLNLLSLTHDPQRMGRLHVHLFGSSPSLRANAAEWLHNVLPGALAREVVPLLVDGMECGPLRIALPQGGHAATGGRLSDAMVERLLGCDPWARAITWFHFEQCGTPRQGGNMAEEDRGLCEIVRIVSFLKQVDIFEGVSSNELASLAEIVVERQYFVGETLFTEGDIPDSMYVIRAGSVRVVKGQKELAIARSRQYLGDLALLDGLPHAATATVAEDAQVLRIGSDDFRAVIAAHPEVSMALLQTMANRLRRGASHVADGGADNDLRLSGTMWLPVA